MAIVHVTSTSGAVAPGERASPAAEPATLTGEAKGFAGSAPAPAPAPAPCRTSFDERPRHAFPIGAGTPAGVLPYVTITILADAASGFAKRKLDAGIAAAVLGRERCPPVPDNRNRVRVRFIDVAGGDLVAGGEATSLAGRAAAVAAVPAT